MQILNMLNVNYYKKSLTVTEQRKELVKCVDDLVMDENLPVATLNKIVKLIYKESLRLNRQDVIENLDLHCLIG